jgi:hypothetical protein
LDDGHFGYITKPLNETLVAGFCCTQLRLAFCNTQITGYPFFSVFFREGPPYIVEDSLLKAKKEPHLFVRRPHQKERKDKRVSFCKVALQKS